MVETGHKISMLTCYDATTARWLERAGVESLLVGDTAAEMILGHPSTIHAPLDFMVEITAAVKRGAPGAFVVADMPFMSYQADGAEAVRNAGRFLTEGRADAVKLEVTGEDAALVKKLSHAGIPVMAHIGSRPQQSVREGGYRSTGKTAAQARRILEEAETLALSGAVMLLVEATTAPVSKRIVKAVNIPVIGCGAGPDCDGHVVVLQDMLGMTDWQPPFAKPMTRMGTLISNAARDYIKLVRSNKYLRKNHPYKMGRGEEKRI